jgi:hypothetical protein
MRTCFLFLPESARGAPRGELEMAKSESRAKGGLGIILAPGWLGVPKRQSAKCQGDCQNLPHTSPVSPTKAHTPTTHSHIAGQHQIGILIRCDVGTV